MEQYLKATYYIESEHERIVQFAQDRTRGAGSDIGRAVRLFYAVRDEFRYNPYCYTFEKEKYRASHTLQAGEGFCIQKAILMAAAARAVKIPCRVGYANVINHLSSKKITEMLRTDLFVFHGYNVLFLNGRWVKATPVFDKALCEKRGLKPLDFDGVEDSVFHPYDLEGKRHMEYVHDYGAFDDFPYDMMLQESIRYYPHIAPLIGKFTSGGDYAKGKDADFN